VISYVYIRSSWNARIEGVTSITANTSEITSSSDVSKYILGGVAIIGGIIYIVQKDDTTSNYNN
jgi:hypothetical protein